MAVAIPDEFVCPISGDVMRDPVWLSTGIAVDRTYAEYYLQAGFRQCPVTGETITNEKLVPVPNMQLYIQKWGRRVGFDLNVQPSDEALTHAIIQAAEHAGSQRRVSSLPRATPEEIAEARRAAGASEPSSPTSPAAEAAAAAEKRAEEEDKKAAADAAAAVAAAAADDQPKSAAKPSDISLTLKGWAAANAVQTPEEEDGSSTPHADSPRLSPRLEGDEGGIRRIKGPGGVPPGHDGVKKANSSGGLFGKVFGSRAAAQRTAPSAVSRMVGASSKSRTTSPLPSPRASPRGSRRTSPAPSPQASPRNHHRPSPPPSPRQAAVATANNHVNRADGRQRPAINDPRPETVESPTKAAERAAAAWTPPPPSTAAKSVDTVRTRPRRSASSYAAYTAADTAAFEAAFGAHLVPPKDVISPAPSPTKLDATGSNADSDDILATALAQPAPPPPAAPDNDVNNLRTRSAVQRRRSYSPYAPGGLFARRPDPSPQAVDRLAANAADATPDINSLRLRSSDGGSLMEEVQASEARLRSPSPPPRKPGQPASMVAPTPPDDGEASGAGPQLGSAAAAAAAAAALPVRNEFEEPDVAIPTAAPVEPDVALKAVEPPVPEVAKPPPPAVAAKPARPTSFTSWIRGRSGSQDSEATAQAKQQAAQQGAAPIAAAPQPTAAEPPQRSDSLSSDELAAAAAAVDQQLNPGSASTPAWRPPANNGAQLTNSAAGSAAATNAATPAASVRQHGGPGVLGNGAVAGAALAGAAAAAAAAGGAAAAAAAAASPSSQGSFRIRRAGSQTDMSESLRASSTPGGATPDAGATPEAGGPVTPQNAHLRSASMSSAGSGGAYGDTSGGKIAEYAQLTQSIRNRRASRGPSDANSTDSGGDGGGPGRLLGAAAAEYTATLRSRRSNSFSSEADLQGGTPRAATATVTPEPSGRSGIFGRVGRHRRNSSSQQSLVSLASIGRNESFGGPETPLRRSPSGANQRMQDQAEVVAIIGKMREVRDPKQVAIPLLGRLAVLVEDNDEMRSYFVAAGGAPRLSQLAAADHPPLKVAAARVVWYLARNPAVAMELMRCNLVPVLYHGLAKQDVSDQLPLIGALVHFNCHNQELVPFGPAGVRTFIEALLIAGASAEDALAASFCLCRIYESGKPPAGDVLKLLGGAAGGVQALVAMLGLPFCSGSEAAAKLLGALAQNIAGLAAKIAHHGGVTALVQLLECPVASGRTAAAQSLAKIIAAAPASRSKVPINEVAGPLFDMLRAGDAAGAEAAAWLLGYCATEPVARRTLSEAGAASALMPVLAGSAGVGAREGAAWAADQISSEVGGVEPFAAAGACPALLGLVRTGKTLGRDSALRMLAAIARSQLTDGVTLVGSGGLKAVLPLLTAKATPDNQSTREAAMEVVRAMVTQNGVTRRGHLDIAVGAGAVKAIVNIARTGTVAGRDSAAAALAELSAADSKQAMVALKKEKAAGALVAVLVGGSPAGKEAAAVALANLCAGSKDVAAEVVKAHALVGLNQLLLGGTPSGRAAGAAFAARLAPSAAFQKSEHRAGLVVNLANLLGQQAAATRVAAAEALAAMGDSNAANWAVVQKGVPHLIQMLRAPDLLQVEAAAAALATVAKSQHIAPQSRQAMASVASRVKSAGVVGPATVAHLDTILASCRGLSRTSMGGAAEPDAYARSLSRDEEDEFPAAPLSQPPPASSSSYRPRRHSAAVYSESGYIGMTSSPSGRQNSGYQAPAEAGTPPWAAAAASDDGSQAGSDVPPLARSMSLGSNAGFNADSQYDYRPPPLPATRGLRSGQYNDMSGSYGSSGRDDEGTDGWGRR